MNEGTDGIRRTPLHLAAACLISVGVFALFALVVLPEGAPYLEPRAPEDRGEDLEAVPYGLRKFLAHGPLGDWRQARPRLEALAPPNISPRARDRVRDSS